MRLDLTATPCPTARCNSHTNIQSVNGNLFIDSTVAGSLKGQVLLAAQMRAKNGPSQMWHECREFDVCTDGAKIEKVENYLANESFTLKDRQVNVDEASMVVHVEEVWLAKQFRGEGRALWMIRELVRQLAMPEDGVVMLQAGSLSREERVGECLGKSDESAHDKIARHWKKLGFEEWSDSDDAWLCLRRSEMKQPAGSETHERL